MLATTRACGVTESEEKLRIREEIRAEITAKAKEITRALVASVREIEGSLHSFPFMQRPLFPLLQQGEELLHEAEVIPTGSFALDAYNHGADVDL